PPASSSTVHNFCTSSDYKARFVAPGYKMLHSNGPDPIQPIDLIALYAPEDIVYLSSDNSEDRTQLFRMYDLAGKIMYESNSLPGSLNMNPYSQGIYILQFTTENGTTTEKIFRR